MLATASLWTSCRRCNNESVPFAVISQALHRAKFADLLLEEVAASLEPPTRENVEEELRDLDLLPYCQPALKRAAGSR